VLFTRAKQKIVTFSSMTASDVMAEEHTNAGAYMLKRWLEYSASGVLETGKRTEREPDSDFEIFVMNQIRSMGCEAMPQVGVAGYFVDIGVRHPELAVWLRSRRRVRRRGLPLGQKCARPGPAEAGNSRRARVAASQDLVH
jgi:hypothetical protein